MSAAVFSSMFWLSRKPRQAVMKYNLEPRPELKEAAAALQWVAKRRSATKMVSTTAVWKLF
ncbi:MAG: hypothetical protein E6L08_07215 [Verrucomicrobia bacterium]|nr:MAG: hypothetical protein E6L08_07215 [Verrucomicrobiota bacterium]